MQRELGALSDGAEENKHSNQRNGWRAEIEERYMYGHRSQMRKIVRCQNLLKAQRIVDTPHPQQHHAHEHNGIADACRNERLERSFFSRFFLEPEADEQVTAEAHQFPEDEKSQQ